MSKPPYAMSKENELLLDVHVPIKGEKLPVMVYIHGGSYQIGGPGFESFILQFWSHGQRSNKKGGKVGYFRPNFDKKIGQITHFRWVVWPITFGNAKLWLKCNLWVTLIWSDHCYLKLISLSYIWPIRLFVGYHHSFELLAQGIQHFSFSIFCFTQTTGLKTLQHLRVDFDDSCPTEDILKNIIFSAHLVA